MMRNSLRRAGALGVIVTALVTAGVSSPASAQAAEDDVQQLVENLPATTDSLIAGLQAATDTAAETQSLVETSAVLGQAVVDSGWVLVSDTELTYIGSSVHSVEASTQFALDDYLGVVDGTHDPTLLLSIDDVQLVVERLPDASNNMGWYIREAISRTLQGDLVGSEGPNYVIVGPSTTGYSLEAISHGSAILTSGGSLIEEQGVLVSLLYAGAYITAGSVGEPLMEAQESVAPIFRQLGLR